MVVVADLDSCHVGMTKRLLRRNISRNDKGRLAMTIIVVIWIYKYAEVTPTGKWVVFGWL